MSLDLDDLRQRINSIRAGNAPADSVTDDELISALNQLRENRRSRVSANAKATNAKANVTPQITTRPGGLLDRLNNAK